MLIISQRVISRTPSPSADQELRKARISATSTPAVHIAKQCKQLLQEEDEEKENAHPTEALVSKKEEKLTSRVAKVVSKADNVNLSRADAFLKRFFEWRATQKHKDALKAKAKVKPFMPAGISTLNCNSKKHQTVEHPTVSPTETIEAMKVFVRGKSQFKPPTGLKNPATSGPLAVNCKFSQLPPRNHETTTKTLSVSSRKTQPLTNLKQPASKRTTIKTPNVKNDEIKISAPRSMPILKKTPLPNVASTPSCFSVKTTNRPMLPAKSTKENNVKKVSQITTTSNMKPVSKPPAFKLPPAPKPKAIITKSTRDKAVSNLIGARTGAVGKAKALQQKKEISVSKLSNAQTQIQQKPLKQKETKLSVRMKSKKPTSAVSTAVKQISEKFKLKSTTLLDVGSTSSKEISIAETPTDGPNSNPFEAFVTSTKMKSVSSSASSQAENELSTMCETISPVEGWQPQSAKPTTANNKGMCSIKRATQLSKENTLQTDKTENKCSSTNKFNFVRYFPINTQTTPGKKRENSIIKDNVAATNKSGNLRGATETKSTTSAELAVVDKLRRQLSQEIMRLHGLCDEWEAYKLCDLSRLQETGGDDMINATIGQAKLLTSKKFMQFKGLIDRCEACAMGVGAVADDGSEETKPVLAVDLEGFWSMVGLQVENVDKRFENLNRWKANNWIDPDEAAKPKIKKNLSKVTKAKTSTANTKTQFSSGVQHLRKLMMAEMRKKKTEKTNEEDVILTPSARQNHKRRSNSVGTPSMPDRISIIVRDRKSRSAAPTVVSIPTPNRRSSLQKSYFSPKLLRSSERFRRSLANFEAQCSSNDLLKTALISAKNQVKAAEKVDVPIENIEPIEETQTNVEVSESKPTTSTECTPTKSVSDEQPANYLSPFVSVTRGKVSARREQEKRNSIYLPSTPTNSSDATKASSVEEAAVNDAALQQSVEKRRTLEAVRYFYRRLNEETARLLTMCDIWESYKLNNLSRLQESGCDDMINATIGQTRLLTSKKFMQFKGLIDRCEAGVTGVGAAADDGSEKTKPISAVDLEGFWSMVGLQVDNVDERFENLNRWKANNWVDPDEAAKPKVKKNLSKVTKAKTNTANSKPQASSGVQHLRKLMIAEMRKKKAAEQNTQEDVILTPSSRQKQKRRSNGSGTPSTLERISIIVRDRKSRSAAPTVVSIPTSARNSPMTPTGIIAKNSPKLLRSAARLRRSLAGLEKDCTSGEMLKTLLCINNKQNCFKSPIQVKTPVRTEMSPRLSVRKSILKTPGTARSKLKSVNFHEHIQVKKFNLDLERETHVNEIQPMPIIDIDDNDDENDNGDGIDSARTYKLRSRKVVLRPSMEIVIPK